MINQSDPRVSDPRAPVMSVGDGFRNRVTVPCELCPHKMDFTCQINDGLPVIAFGVHRPIASDYTTWQLNVGQLFTIAPAVQGLLKIVRCGLPIADDGSYRPLMPDWGFREGKAFWVCSSCLAKCNQEDYQIQRELHWRVRRQYPAAHKMIG